MERSDRSWAPVTERMPDKEWMEYGERTGLELEVIVKIEYAKSATVLYYDGHDGFYDVGDDGERTYYPVSHWMMLPGTPKEVSNESY